MEELKWNGGECPVSSEVMVRVWLNNGQVSEGYPARRYQWVSTGLSGDIIAYEVIEEAPESPEEPKPIMASEKTLRDEFAMRAMQAYITSMTEGQEPIEHASGICEHSYLFADEMMKARAK